MKPRRVTFFTSLLRPIFRDIFSEPETTDEKVKKPKKPKKQK